MLFISGFSDHAPPELAAFGRLLQKPFTPVQLLEAVRKAIEDPLAGRSSGASTLPIA
jgi:hypothetical protein